MDSEKTTQESTLSKSAAKRLQRKKEIAAAKRKAKIAKWVLIGAGLVILGVITYFTVDTIYFNAIQTKATNDFSAELTEDGHIKGVDAADYLEPFDYENITIPYADVEYTQAKMDEDIETVLNSNKYYSEEKTLEVVNGSVIKLDYSGSVDGVAFDNGTATDQNLTIGSGSMIDGFETQLIGSHPGDTFDINVTFPTEYSKNPDLAGKDAVFAITIKSIQVVPEFTDEFVAENLSYYANTTEEYKQYLKDSNYSKNMDTVLDQYIQDNAVAKKYPQAYLKAVRGLTKYSDLELYGSYNELMQASYGYTYDSFEEYIKLDKKAYEKKLRKIAKELTTTFLAYQYIFDKAGLTITDEMYAKVTEGGSFGSDAASSEASYGKGCLMQHAMKLAVLEYLKTVVTVEK